MKETQDILIQMGFENIEKNVWRSEWFGHFLLLDNCTPEELAKFIFARGQLTKA